MTAPSIFLSIREVCAATGMGDVSVYRALAAGEIPGVRIGGRWKISRVAFERWHEAGCPKQRSPERVA